MANLSANLSENIIKFRSAKSRKTAWTIGIPAFLVLAGAIINLFLEDFSRGIWFTTSIFLIIHGTLCWMWFDTGYDVSETHLHYHSGPMKGKIGIDSIRKIERKTEVFGGMKPALGSHGIIVHYNKFDDIYLSPENQEAFIRELTLRNPTIQVEV
jgi:hypothetical protein